MEIYVVRPGDSVDSIARALDANVELLIYWCIRMSLPLGKLFW